MNFEPPPNPTNADLFENFADGFFHSLPEGISGSLVRTSDEDGNINFSLEFKLTALESDYAGAQLTLTEIHRLLKEMSDKLDGVSRRLELSINGGANEELLRELDKHPNIDTISVPVDFFGELIFYHIMTLKFTCHFRIKN